MSARKDFLQTGDLGRQFLGREFVEIELAPFDRGQIGGAG